MAISRAGSIYDDGGWTAASPSRTHERHWQFRIMDGKGHSARNGAHYFEKRANELAAALGCRVTAIKNVKVEMSPASVWMVKGIALLENPRENVSAVPKIQA